MLAYGIQNFLRGMWFIHDEQCAVAGDVGGKWYLLSWGLDSWKSTSAHEPRDPSEGDLMDSWLEGEGISSFFWCCCYVILFVCICESFHNKYGLKINFVLTVLYCKTLLKFFLWGALSGRKMKITDGPLTIILTLIF